MDELDLELNKLFVEVAELIGGFSLVRLNPRVALVVKEDVVLEYKLSNDMKGKYESSCYVFSCPIATGSIEFSIYNKQKKKIYMDMERENNINDFSVYTGCDNSSNLINCLFKDTDFKGYLVKYLENCNLSIHNNVLSLKINESLLSNLIGKKVCAKKVVEAYTLLLEARKAIEFYYKKI